MKKAVRCFIVACCMIMLPMGLMAGEVDDLVKKGVELYEQDTIESVTESIKYFEKAMELDPDNYDAVWHCSEANGMVGEISKQDKLDGWKHTCKVHGKKGINLAKKAQKLNPDRPEGYFFQAWNIGIYSDGVSVVTAVKENLKKQAEHGFNTTYKIDKHWNDGVVIMGAGHYWEVLPWPFRDKKKALRYFEEYEELGYLGNTKHTDIAKMYYSDLLMDMKGKKYKDKARQFCTELVAESDSEKFREDAQKYLDKLNKK